MITSPTYVVFQAFGGARYASSSRRSQAFSSYIEPLTYYCDVVVLAVMSGAPEVPPSAYSPTSHPSSISWALDCGREMFFFPGRSVYGSWFHGQNDKQDDRHMLWVFDDASLSLSCHSKKCFSNFLCLYVFLLFSNFCRFFVPFQARVLLGFCFSFLFSTTYCFYISSYFLLWLIFLCAVRMLCHSRLVRWYRAPGMYVVRLLLSSAQ